MTKSNSNSLQVAQTAYQGGARQVIAEMLGSRANWHFGASSMKVRFVDGAETALTGEMWRSRGIVPIKFITAAFKGQQFLGRLRST